MRPSTQRGRGRPAGGCSGCIRGQVAGSQTANATEEISGQIAAVQKVALEAVEAIKGIGGIISEVNGVASAIAAAVEQEGAATQEIAR
jgi:phosphohistidine swiveling domain-containing protein